MQSQSAPDTAHQNRNNDRERQSDPHYSDSDREKLKTSPNIQTATNSLRQRTGIMNWGNSCYLGSALQASYDILDIHDDSNHLQNYKMGTKIPHETIDQIAHHISGENIQTDHIPHDILKT